jgi:hypothetical protein
VTRPHLAIFSDIGSGAGEGGGSPAAIVSLSIASPPSFAVGFAAGGTVLQLTVTGLDGQADHELLAAAEAASEPR